MIGDVVTILDGDGTLKSGLSTSVISSFERSTTSTIDNKSCYSDDIYGRLII